MKEQVKEETVVAPDVAKEIAPKKEVKTYENSHLIQYCGKCNSKSILIENIPSTQGITINLPPTNEAEFMLVCKDCGNKMGIFYVETAKKTTEVKIEEVTDEDEKQSIHKASKKK